MIYPYIFDANIFIEGAKRYPFNRFPSLWQAFELAHKEGQIASIAPVFAEIKKGNETDPVRLWVEKLPKTWWQAVDTEECQQAYAKMANALYLENGNFVEFFQETKTDKIADFLDIADSWLSAYCMDKNTCLVTEEKYNQHTRRKLLIPVVCKHFSVKYCDLLELLESLNLCF